MLGSRPGRPARRWLAPRFVLATALVICALPAGYASAAVQIVQSGTAALYRDAEAGLRAELPAGDVVPDAVPASELRPACDGCDAIIAIGTRALDAALQRAPAIPVLGVLVPRAAYEIARAEHADRQAPLSALFLDQPLERHLGVANRLFPRLKTFGVLLAGDTSAADYAADPDLLPPLESARLGPAETPVEAIAGLASRVDALVAVPDPRIYNASTVHGILLSSYRADLPIFGYSDSLVRAGGLASAWLPPRAHGAEAGAMFREYRSSAAQAWPAARYTRSFRITINHRVARSLGLRPAFTASDRVFHGIADLP